MPVQSILSIGQNHLDLFGERWRSLPLGGSLPHRQRLRQRQPRSPVLIILSLPIAYSDDLCYIGQVA
jgi:hypothetical protein